MSKIKKNSHVPLYVQLSNLLRKQVRNGEFKSGSRLPSENELSRKYSISRMTAREALMQLGREGLVANVLGKGRFVVENKDEPFPPEHFSAFTVAVYGLRKLPHRADSYSSGVLNGLTQGFLRHNLRSKFFDQEEIENFSLSLISFFSREGIDGVIWFCPQKKEFARVMELKEKRLPVVAVNRTFPGSGIDYVACDHYKGSYQLVEHLIRMGHKKIACITGVRSLELAAQRWKGYLDAHNQYGLSIKQELTIEAENYATDIPQKLHTLRKKKDWPTAIFIAGGAFIECTIRYLNEERIKIPEQVSLVAFDEIILPPGSLKLTCVRQPLENMGEMAVDILLRNLRGSNRHPAEIILEPTFILGDSCIPRSKMPGDIINSRVKSRKSQKKTIVSKVA